MGRTAASITRLGRRWLAAAALCGCLLAPAVAESTIIAIGDVHGAFAEFEALLRGIGLIDAEHRWRGGDTKLVSLGDLLDRGPDSRRVMDLLRDLQAQAPAAGGQVHVLLGNHEAMNLIGDLRDVSAAEFAAYANDEPTTAASAPPVDRPVGYAEHRRAFAPGGDYGAWLLGLPAVLQIGDTLFMHGGLTPATAALGVAGINARVTADLRAAIAAGHTTTADTRAAYPLLGGGGPLWYRGLTSCHPLIEGDRIDAVLKALNARRMVVGHTPTPSRAIEARHDGRVIAIDTGMLRAFYRGQPRALRIEGERLAALDENGKVSALATPTGVRSGNDAAEAQIAAALARATPSGVDAATGLLQFDLEGTRFEARFVATGERAARRATALWRLDRLLGVALTPLTITYRLNGKSGYLYLVHGKWMPETRRAERGLSRPNHCTSSGGYAVLAAFDALTRSKPRRGEFLSYNTRNWRIRVTEQHETFGTQRKVLDYGDDARLPLALRKRLQQLDAETLQQRLGDWLPERELRALLSRRDKLLEWAS
ncbi:MAG: metallophosphoesterase [Pseudomonadota bacterium]